MVKRLTVSIAAVLIMLGIVFVFAANESYADDFSFDRESIDFDTDLGQYDMSVKVMLNDCFEKITSVVPKGSGVVYVDESLVYDEIFFVQAIGKGDDKLIITGSKGSTAEIPVHVGDKGLYQTLEDWSRVERICYGDPKVIVESIPGVKVTVKMGSDKYSATLSDTPAESVRKGIKTSKFHKAGTKVTVTFSKDGVSYSETEKIQKFTYVGYLKGKSKTLKVQCFNPHAGDVIKITIGGKTYTKKVKKSYNKKDYSFSMKTKKKISKKASFKVVIKNKFKQTLRKQSGKLRNGEYVVTYLE